MFHVGRYSHTRCGRSRYCLLVGGRKHGVRFIANQHGSSPRTSKSIEQSPQVDTTCHQARDTSVAGKQFFWRKRRVFALQDSRPHLPAFIPDPKTGTTPMLSGIPEGCKGSPRTISFIPDILHTRATDLWNRIMELGSSRSFSVWRDRDAIERWVEQHDAKAENLLNSTWYDSSSPLILSTARRSKRNRSQ